MTEEEKAAIRTAMKLAYGIPVAGEVRSTPLLPCPCCGGRAERQPIPFDSAYRERIVCIECGLSTRGTGFGSIEDAWNRRHEDPKDRAFREAAMEWAKWYDNLHPSMKNWSEEEGRMIRACRALQAEEDR
jgi:hypothetical protein